MPFALVRRTKAVLFLLGLSTAVASAAEPSGCAGFKWPIDRERALLTAGDPVQLASGAELPAPAPAAVTLKLRPSAEAALPATPERPPAADRFAGFLRIRQIAKPGTSTNALSAAGWIDAIQNGHPLKPSGFSGATDCDGVRKLVRYNLSAGDLLLQVSGVSADAVTLAIVPVE